MESGEGQSLSEKFTLDNKVPVFEATKKLMYRLGHLQGIKHIDMSGLQNLSEASTGVISIGANPCVAFAAVCQDGIWIGHSHSVLTRPQQQIINRARCGIVGGGSWLLEQYKTLFGKHSIRVIPPLPDYEDWMFCVAAVKENTESIKPGVYYQNIIFGK